MLMYLKHNSSILKICSILLSPEHEEGMEILSWDMDVFSEGFLLHSVTIVLYGCIVFYQRWVREARTYFLFHNPSSN